RIPKRRYAFLREVPSRKSKLSGLSALPTSVTWFLSDMMSPFSLLPYTAGLVVSRVSGRSRVVRRLPRLLRVTVVVAGQKRCLPPAGHGRSRPAGEFGEWCQRVAGCLRLIDDQAFETFCGLSDGRDLGRGHVQVGLVRLGVDGVIDVQQFADGLADVGAGVGCGLVAAACGGPLWIAHVRPSRSFFSIRMSRKRFIRPISILHGLSVSAIHIHTFRLRADERLIMPVIVRAGKLEQAADAELLAIAQRLAHRLT